MPELIYFASYLLLGVAIGVVVMFVGAALIQHRNDEMEKETWEGAPPYELLVRTSPGSPAPAASPSRRAPRLASWVLAASLRGTASRRTREP